MKWENAYVFISSTFNDMHAERDFLVKRVFPDLRLWCQKRKIKLIDIDLRWGVSEEDATENKKVVDICLKNIDKCRPFFLCFLGQRRGWVPMNQDVHSETLKHYPGLENYIGKQSITELEIIHALLEPLTSEEVKIPKPLFYFRKPDYIAQIQEEAVRNIYISEEDERKKLEQFKNIVQEKYFVYEYDAVWDEELNSPELAGVGEGELTQGRLKQFMVDEIAMAEHVLEHMKELIEAEFPDRKPMSEDMSTLEKELDWQDGYLSSLADSYIRRPEEECKIWEYIYKKCNRPYVLEAEAGSGKTSLLAYILTQISSKNRFYRFVGTSQESSDLGTMLGLLYEELGIAGFLGESDVRDAKGDCLVNFQKVLETVAGKMKRKNIEGPLVFILDAIDQFRFSEELPYWIPTNLPEQIKLIVSLKTDLGASRNRYLHQGDYEICSLNLMKEDREKRRMIEEYLGQFLKTVDESQIEQLFDMKGSSNPLYLKIVLNELRIHGSFESLKEKLSINYGSTPQEAFQSVLARLEKESFLEISEARALLVLFMAMMAYSLEGIDIPYTAKLLTYGVREFKSMQQQQIADAMYIIAKHLSPYLVMNGNRVDFLYESFRIAAAKRYAVYEKMSRKLLAIGYRILLNTDSENLRYDRGKKSDMASLAYQITNHSIEEANVELLSPWFVYEYCRRLGAGALAEQYYLAARLAEESYIYEEMGNALVSVQAKVSVYPRIVFVELKKLLGEDHGIFGKILAKMLEMPGQFFRQVNVHEKSLIPQKELLAYRKDVIEYFVHSKWLSYRLRSSEVNGTATTNMLFQNLANGKIEKIVQLPQESTTFWSHEDYLYVRYKEPNLNYVVYEVPSMRVVLSGDFPEYEEGFRWHSLIRGWKEDVFGTCSNKAEDMRVVNLRTGQIVWEYKKKETDGYFRWYFQGKLMFVTVRDTIMQLVDITTGAIVWEDREGVYGEFMSNDECGYLLCKKNDKPMWHYIHYVDNQAIVEPAREMKPYALGNSYAVIKGHLCSFMNNQIWVFDKEMNCLGYQTTKEQMRDVSGETPTLYERGNYAIYVDSVSISLYSIEELFQGLKIDAEKVQVRGLNGQMVHGKYLYLFYSNGGVEKVDLDTSSVVAYDQDICVTYHKKNVFCWWGSDYIAGYHSAYSWEPNYRDYRICVKNVDTLKTVIRMSGKAPEGMMLQGVFLLDGKVGMVFRSHDDFAEEKVLFAPDGSDRKYQMKKCVIWFTSDFEEFEKWDPQIQCAGLVELFVHQNELYLIFEETYIDCCHVGAKIYHVKNRNCVCEVSMTINCQMYFFQMINMGGTLGVYVRRYEAQEKKNHRELYLMNYLTGNVTIKEFPKSFEMDGHHGEEIYLTEIEDDCTRKVIQVVSSKNGEVMKRIPCTHQRGMDTKIIKKYGGYLVYYQRGILEVYTDDSDGPVFSQMLPKGTLIDRSGTGEFIIASEDNRYYVYTLDRIQNLAEKTRYHKEKKD